MKKNKYHGMYLTLTQTLQVKLVSIFHRMKKKKEKLFLTTLILKENQNKYLKDLITQKIIKEVKKKKRATMVKFGEMHGFNHQTNGRREVKILEFAKIMVGEFYLLEQIYGEIIQLHQILCCNLVTLEEQYLEYKV